MNPCSIGDWRVLGAWCAAGGLGLALAASASGGPLFGNPVWRSMSDARTVAWADLDGDEDLDLVVANFSDQSVSIFLTNEACELLEQSSISLGSNVDCVALGNVDGVNGPDIVTAHATDGQIGVLLNNGDGTFPDPPNFYPAATPCRLSLVDLDDANGLDIVAANRDGSDLQTLDNLGDGTFDVATGASAGSHQLGTATGDLDGDSWPDAVVCSTSTSEAVVLINDGAGNLSNSSAVSLTSSPNGVAIADLDGDSYPDLAIACSNNEVVIALNDGSGLFSVHDTIGVTGQPKWIAAGDLDLDSYPDLVTANADTHLASILFNNGDATYTVMDELNTTRGPACVDLVDMDDDDDLDVLLAHDGGEGFSIIPHVAPYGYTTFAYTDTATQPVGPVLVDVGEDSNEDLDAIVGSAYSQTPEFRVHPGDGAGNFEPEDVYPLSDTVRDLAAADFDDDGDADLVLCLNDRRVVVYENDGSGGYGTTEAWSSADLGHPPLAVRVGDLDGDTAPDLAIVYNGILGVYLNQGSCQFGGFQDYSSGYPTSDIALGDVDSDGDYDVIAASSDSGYFHNDGAGGFSTDGTVDYTVFEVGDPAHSIDADFVTAWNGFRAALVRTDPGPPASSTMTWLQRDVQDGEEIFYAQSYPGGPGPSWVISESLQYTLGDDILIADATAGSVFVYRFAVGPGGEDFTGPTPYAVGPNPQGVAAGDLNGDGFLDIVTQNGIFDQLSVALQVPPPCIGDLDDDGQTDIYDFAHFVINFGEGPDATRQMGDLDGNGFVNIFDFAMLLSNFGCGTGGAPL